MMYEGQITQAMFNAERYGAPQAACEYLITLLIFTGHKEDDIPAPPIVRDATHDVYLQSWSDYYFKLLRIFAKRISANLIEIRSKYKEKNEDIPDIGGNK